MLDVVVRVLSPDLVPSPISGERGAFVRLELVEDGKAIGAVILGDLVRFGGPDGTFDLIVRRTNVVVAPIDARPLGNMPAELVPLLRMSRGRGALAVREHVVRSGAEVRLRGTLVAGQLAGPVTLFVVD